MLPPLDDESFVAFLEESREHLATLEQSLLALEAQGGVADDATINSIFRAAHTIKGTAGFFALDAVKELAHAAENVLGMMRSHELSATPEVISALLESTDLLGRMLADVEHIAQVDARDVLVRLRAVSSAPATVPATAPAASPTPEPASASPAPPPPPPTTAPAPGAEPESDAPRKADGASTVRVNLAQLDRLMLLAGELVLTRNALLKKAGERDLGEMINLSQRVDAITSEIQDGVMATRMQPVGIVFTKFRRVVRDLARTLSKKLEIHIEGEEVELDKTLIEALGDPLTHLVRNSADHGIESPSKRLSLGKPEAGRLELRAFHEAGQVVIEVRDDGAGIDPERVAAKALEQRLYTREQLEAMSNDEKVRLVFAPGFSTAAQVTEVSGRGVGMDVVLSSLTKVGGTVDIRSEVGRGTTITVHLPLTLAIIPSLLVGVNDERFAIPQVNLVELVRIPAGEVQRRVERVGSASVMRLRGELLPLLRLSDVLGVTPTFTDAAGERHAERRVLAQDRRSPDLLADPSSPAAPDERRRGGERRVAPSSAVNVVVVASGTFRYGLVVDQLLDSEEIVVKPLGSHLSGCREYAGATILGDGAVALILDVSGICAASNLAATKALAERAEAKRRGDSLAHDAQTYLVVENAPGERFALPLGLVSRIEKVRRDAVVTLAGRATVTHGTDILPLLAIEDVARVTPRVPAERFSAIICRVGGREVGLAVSRVEDVVEGTAPIDSATHVQPGILGSTVLDGSLMLLVDVHGLVDALLPEYRRPRTEQPEGEEAPVVLVVEDSPFFRKQIVSCLAEDGLQTLAAEDGEQGLLALEQHAGRVRLVITDIEMPRMDGLELARRIRADGRFSALPVLACTSVSGEVAERRGREAGLTEYLIKLDRELIVERANHHLNRTRGPGLTVSKGAGR